MIWLLFSVLVLQMDSDADPAEAFPVGTGIIIVEAVGFESNEGQAVVCVFTEGQWSVPPDPNNAVICMIEEIENQAVYAEIDSLQPSDYGVLVFHDLDCDTVFDPEEEPWGIFGKMQMMGPSISGDRPSGGGPPGRGPQASSGMFLEIDNSVGVARIVVELPETSAGPPGGFPGGGPPSGGGGMPGW
ncbi:MAG: DUF2141 domain-containing protein [Sphaerochaetaceae bacterium]|nr:DUF2141 domain-containing protein [Sphaerochaetaceae bacterium]